MVFVLVLGRYVHYICLFFAMQWSILRSKMQQIFIPTSKSPRLFKKKKRIRKTQEYRENFDHNKISIAQFFFPKMAYCATIGLF